VPRDKRSAAARPVWQQPVVQFVVVGLIVAAVLAWITGVMGERLAREQAIDDARTRTELIAETVIEPSLSSGLLGIEAGDLDRFDRVVRAQVLGGDIVRVKVWDADGRIIYSDEPELLGQTFDLSVEQHGVLEGAGPQAEISDLSRSENEFEAELVRVLEVYTLVEAPNGEPLLFELYLTDATLQARADELFSLFRPLTVGGILLFLLVTTPLVWVVSRRADAAAADRERYLVMATEASDAERRRVARDLHDGVVQDLAGTSFALSGLARDMHAQRDGEPARRDISIELERLAAAVRSSLLSLRSLLVEIYPPQLQSDGLGAALQDLVAPVQQSGVDVSVTVAGAERMSDQTTALVWRSAQECVRNAVRHGRPSELSIDVRVVGDPPVAVMSVIDNGAGFEPGRDVAKESFGLRGIRDLAHEARGTLTVASSPGEGAAITLEVPAT
jgi:two-component system NarL family sensor kinase